MKKLFFIIISLFTAQLAAEAKEDALQEKYKDCLLESFQHTALTITENYVGRKTPTTFDSAKIAALKTCIKNALLKREATSHCNALAMELIKELQSHPNEASIYLQGQSKMRACFEQLKIDS